VNHTVVLRNPEQAHAAFVRLWQTIKSCIASGQAIAITAKEESRSLAQNSLLHALLTEIAETRDWAGSRRSVECWKRLFVASWCRAKGESVEVLPALDGNGIDVVFRRTSEMSKAEVSDLVEYIHAWHAQQETT
jgi:hypothetical protein